MLKPHEFYCRNCRKRMIPFFDVKNKNNPIQTGFTLGCLFHKYIDIDIKDNDLYCRDCKTKIVEVVHSEEGLLKGYRPVLRDFNCPKCHKLFTMKLNDFIPGTEKPLVVNNHLENDPPIIEDNRWTEEDKRRIQEEEGLSDEDMANGAWIDF